MLIRVVFVLVSACLPSLALAQGSKPAKPPAPMPGLVATVAGGGRSVSFLVPTPGFSFAEGESLHPQIGAGFSATFDGLLTVKVSGDYTLSGDATILLNGEPANDKPVKLAKGEHPLRIEYSRRPGGARFQLLWKSDSFATEPVPHWALAHRDEPASLGEGAVAERGRMLVEELNCVGCHRPSAAIIVGRAGPDLSGIGSRAGKAWIYKWLENPQHFRADAAMPVTLKGEEDRRDATAYLATLKDADAKPAGPPPQQGQIDEGSFLFDSVGCTACHTEQRHTVVGVGSKYTHASLTAYLLDPLKVDPSGRMPDMLLTGEEAGAIAAHLMQSKRAEYEVAAPAGDAKRGERVVRESGCLSCHTLGEAVVGGGSPLVPAAPVSLERLDVTRGCLSDQPRAPAPLYELADGDRSAIRAFITSFQKWPDVAAAPAHEFRRTAERFSCTSCHALDATAAGAGNEHVPPLTGAGLKLRENWIGRVLLEKQRVRPWMSQRMPHFGDVLKETPRQMVAAAGAPPIVETPVPAADLVKQGRTLMGLTADGYGCTGCHAYKGSDVTVPPESRGPEMTGMALRVREDWFHRWLRDPNRILPGTAMPNFFFGKPEAEFHSQAGALWAYLTLGEEMPPPEGFPVNDGAASGGRIR